MTPRSARIAFGWHDSTGSFPLRLHALTEVGALDVGDRPGDGPP